MGVSLHLSFDGRCEEAFRFYEKALGGKIRTMLTYAASPMAAQFPEMGEKILHASLVVGGDTTLAGADVSPEQYRKPQGFQALVDAADPADAERMFAALAEGGNVEMPLQETFWALRFGVVTDRFGVMWEVNCEQAPS